MTDLRQAAQQVLEAAEKRLPLIGQASIINELNALRAALEQPEQEPLGWLDGTDKLAEFLHRDLKAEHDKRGSATPRDFTIPVYLAPPAAQRKPLTDEQIANIVQAAAKGSAFRRDGTTSTRIARAVETAHGIKEGT